MTKKRKEKGGSESSIGSDTEKDKSVVTPGKADPVVDPTPPPPTSPVIQGMQEALAPMISQMAMQSQNIEQLCSMFASRSRSLSTKRKRENEYPKGGEKNPNGQTFFSQQLPVKDTTDQLTLSQPNVNTIRAEMETANEGTNKRTNNPPLQKNPWDVRPPHMIPDVIAPPPIPEFDLKTFNEKKDELTLVSKSLVDNAKKLDQNFGRDLDSFCEGMLALIGTLAKPLNSVPDLVKRSAVDKIPNPSVLKQLGKLNVAEVNKTILSVKQNERERELEKSSRSIRLFNAVNCEEESAFKTVERAFKDQPKFTNPLKDAKSFFLGNPKTSKTVPIVVEFQSENHKTEFMSAIRDEKAENENGTRYSASIHWPKDLSDRIKGWKEILNADPKHQDKDFYFSYRKNSKTIKIATCKKNATVRTWETLTTFPIPAKNAKKHFKGLPECLGGEPMMEKTVANLPTASNPPTISESKECEIAPMEQ